MSERDQTEPDIVTELKERTVPKVSRKPLSINAADFIHDALNKCVRQAGEQDRRITKQGVIELGLVKLLGITPPENYKYFR